MLRGMILTGKTELLAQNVRGMILTDKTELLAQNPYKYHSVHHSRDWPGIEPGPPG
jgi:hypothetical protein